jgi:hypothetical protein
VAGWICLHRDIQDHWLFNFDEPDKALAWIDLILLANHEDNKFMIKGQLITCKRGQVAMSQVTLQKRWKMSQNKLKRFLVLLKNDGMIDLETNELTSIITICKYSSYQDIERADGRPDEQPSERATDDQSNDKQQCKQLNNSTTDLKEKELSSSPAQSDIKGDSFVDHTDEVAPLEADQLSDKRKKKTIERDMAIVEVFEFWKNTLDHKRAMLDNDRKKFIGESLKLGYSVDDLNAAIIGCSLTPHNMGVNDNHQKYDGIHIIFKNAANIDRFIANSITPPKQKSPTPATNRNSGYARKPIERPVYTYPGEHDDQAFIDSTATEILHEQARL